MLIDLFFYEKYLNIYSIFLLSCSISMGLQIYREVEDSNTHQLFYHSVTPSLGPLHGIALDEPYKPLDAIDLKRYSARKNETTYCYDFPLVSYLHFLVLFLQRWLACLTP